MAKKTKKPKVEVSSGMSLLLDEISKLGGTLQPIGADSVLKIPSISSGSLQIDKALGGGYAKNKMIELFGQPSSGKTTLALLAAAQVQKEGGVVGFIDMEHALNLDYASQLGVQTSELYMTQPDSGTIALTVLDKMVESGEFDLIIFDSVAAIVSEGELAADVGSAQMGVNARLMSQICRKITPKLSNNTCTVMFLNQLRSNLGGYGSTYVTTGGNALKFYSFQRLEIKNVGRITQGEDIVGYDMRVTVVKNKLAVPYKKANTSLIFGKGVPVEKEILDLAIAEGLVKKAGSWFKYGEVSLGQGMLNVVDMLMDNPELTEELKEKINL